MQLHPSAVSVGVELTVLASIDSTNAEALRVAREGTLAPRWIVANQQTAGRGRRGRTWVSEPGNLYATLLLSEPASREHVAGLSLVAGLAVHDALASSTSVLGPRLQLKWPNDLLLDGRKISGILIEGEGRAVAVGIGVNCLHHPQDTAYPATDLASAGLPLAPDAVFTALSAAMVQRMTQWARGSGFAAIRKDWLARASGLGSAVNIAVGEHQRAGIFETIDDHGCLILRRADGSAETVSAGDVLHARAVASAPGLPA